jgi:phospholipase A1
LTARRSVRAAAPRRLAPPPFASFAALAACAVAPHAVAQPMPAGEAVRMPASVEACATIRGDAERLACYDKAVAPPVKGGIDAPAAPAAGTPAAANAATPAPTVGAPESVFDSFWELSPERKRGTFNFSGYRPSYFFPIHVVNKQNRSPNSPSPGHAGSLPDYRNVEAKVQLSVRTKLLEDTLLPGGDLWFAYTAQSLWQIYDAANSRPFRATDHEPELVYVVPTPYAIGGLKLKMAGLGLAHQSNGQELPFSRSWNRWYLMAGAEVGQFAFTARHNVRIHESDGKDDNPDLTRYRGRTELQANWTPGFHTFSALWKTNFDIRGGSIRLDWTMPVNRKDPKGLRWYVQAFQGYGESLIDYNFRQTSVGAGLTLFGF